MKRSILRLATMAMTSLWVLQGSAAYAQTAQKADITRILETLAADDMEGRAAFSPGIAKAADFISQEFQSAGLEPYAEANFRQTFSVNRTSSLAQEITLKGKALAPEKYLIFNHAKSDLQWDSQTVLTKLSINKDEDFSTSFRSIMRQTTTDAVVWVDPSFAPLLERFKKIYSRESVQPSTARTVAKPSIVFILNEGLQEDLKVSAQQKVETLDLFNVAAVIPGKSKAQELVIFSCHYDHIGIIKGDPLDSIANGADDDASGTTAMISLAKYYKALNNNERTLIFVAFTAEEIGMFGSKYFSSQLNPDEVVAMINIEMIGKDSKFGPNTMYITGYDNSNLGALMQENVKGTAFQFFADPYPQQNLFYRSDNAVLAALGVPAHTFSTSQIDKDEFYHTVKDEVKTLNIENIAASIEAIAQGAIGLVKGTQTPSRVEKLKN